jgi:hypothetical protein
MSAFEVFRNRRGAGLWGNLHQPDRIGRRSVALFREYTGSYIMTFAGYNAGRGRVREWVAKHGDPRDPKIDAVDWVERIPLAETRNYVQRVMENLQVYGARMGASLATVEPNLHRVTTIDSRVKPTFVDAVINYFAHPSDRPKP